MNDRSLPLGPERESNWVCFRRPTCTFPERRFLKVPLEEWEEKSRHLPCLQLCTGMYWFIGLLTLSDFFHILKQHWSLGFQILRQSHHLSTTCLLSLQIYVIISQSSCPQMPSIMESRSTNCRKT